MSGGSAPRQVLLISINRYGFPYPVFPLGLAQVASALERSGYEVRLIDLQQNPGPIEKWFDGFDPMLVGVSVRNIDDALIQKRETFFDGLTELIEGLRRRTSAPVVLGGSGYSIFPFELLKMSGADYGIQGEGELALLQLLEAMENRKEVGEIPGLVYRDSDSVLRRGNGARLRMNRVARLSAFPELTAYYLQHSAMLNIQTQRGCALRCCYCTYPLLEGRSYRRRPADEVVEELGELCRRGARYVFVVDSVFNTSPGHVTGICEGILRRGVKIQWCCFLRPKGLSPELLKLMGRAGLRHVEFGSDSFCDEVLETYGKQMSFEDILSSSRAAHEAGVEVAHFLICGGPGETRETLRVTLRNATRLPPAVVMARVGMRVYPGTPLYETLRADPARGELPDLLRPYYYVSPQLSEASVVEELRAGAARLGNWIIDDPPPRYFELADRLRQRGVVGPLWSYFAMMQRLGGSVAAVQNG